MATTAHAFWEPANPYKAIAEKGFLLFTPIWCLVIGVIMVSGHGAVWGDVELMSLGVTMAFGTLVCALKVCVDECKKRNFNFKQRALAIETVLVMYSGIVALSFAANFLQTPFFFDVLHMRYGFKVNWRYDRNPLFLYLVTVAYFATYASGGMMMYRAVRHFVPSLPRWLLTIVVATLLAFLETATNANHFATSCFCYEDHMHAIGFGSIMYGIMFIFALPAWQALGGVPEEVPTVRDESSVLIVHAVLVNVGVAVVDAVILAGVRRWIAPHFTTVQDGAGPFGKCLTN